MGTAPCLLIAGFYAEWLLDQPLRLRPGSLAAQQYAAARAQVEVEPNDLSARRDYGMEQTYALMMSAILTSLALIPVLMAADATGSAGGYGLAFGLFVLNGAFHTLLLAATAWRTTARAAPRPQEALVRQERAMLLLAFVGAAMLTVAAPPPQP